MNDTCIWIEQDDRAEVMSYEQVLQAAEDGRKAKHIFLAKQELMLRYQLVPKARRDELPVKEKADKAEKVTAKVIEGPKAPEAVEAPDNIEDKRRKRAGRA